MLVDLLIIGGGINGCAVAADAAGRGLSVILCEKDDLASATSSASSKLIHGGLRYLEQYDFKLVHEALKEREILMLKAPFLIRPLEFVLPYQKGIRSKYLIQLGLWLYDLLYLKRTLARSHRINLRKSIEGKALRPEYKTGFSYSDCMTDDSRLVILTAMYARDYRAQILTRTRCESLERYPNYWLAHCYDRLQQKKINITAKVVVNASGPWVSELIEKVAKISSPCHIRLVQGSHILVPKLYKEPFAYNLQNPDGRIVFTIPYQHQFTLIGTTELPYSGNPNLVSITENEIEYLCNTINRFFEKTITKNDIVWSYSGVRPLYDNKTKNLSKISREYHLDLDAENHQAPLLSIFGGKITTHRTLAESAMNILKSYFFNLSPSRTKREKLPGGKCDGLSFTEFVQSLKTKYNWMPEDILHRYAENYGDRCHIFLRDCYELKDMKQHFGAGLYEKEVEYLIQNEWAKNADDILWRRTKLGLYMTVEEISTLENYFEK